jgi:hypothetical protein
VNQKIQGPQAESKEKVIADIPHPWDKDMIRFHILVLLAGANMGLFIKALLDRNK